MPNVLALAVWTFVPAPTVWLPSDLPLLLVPFEVEGDARPLLMPPRETASSLAPAPGRWTVVALAPATFVRLRDALGLLDARSAAPPQRASAGQLRAWLDRLVRQAPANTVSARLHRLWLHLRDDLPGTPVIELAQLAGVTRRQLHRDFTAVLGLTPSLHQRLVRVRIALWDLAHGHALAAVSAAAGFADQSHMAREIRHFTGARPSSLAILLRGRTPGLRALASSIVAMPAAQWEACR